MPSTRNSSFTFRAGSSSQLPITRPNAIITSAPSGNLPRPAGGHGHRTLAFFNPPVLISHQDGGCHRNRRIRADQDANYEGGAESTKHLATEQKECEYGKEGKACCQDGSA